MNNKVIIEIANGVKIKVHKDGINPITEQVGQNK
jgi:hypothetical protein